MEVCAAIVDTVACIGTKANPVGKGKRTTERQRQRDRVRNGPGLLYEKGI